MLEVQSSELKTHLSSLLDKVERGETLVVTRHGEEIARVVPAKQNQQKEIDEAIAGIMEIRKHTKKTTIDEIIASIHEGHKY